MSPATTVEKAVALVRERAKEATQLTVRIDAATMDKLKALSDKNKCTTNALVGAILDVAVNEVP